MGNENSDVVNQVLAPDDMEFEQLSNEFITGLLAREGGDEIITDTGGLTKYGISTRAHGVGSADKGQYDIKNLTEDQAREIYKTQYIPQAIDRVGLNNVAWKFADMTVNMGWGNATKLLQESIGLGKDGNFGGDTKVAIRQSIADLGEAEVIRKLSETQKNYYKRLMKADPEKYGAYKGWIEGGHARYLYNPLKD